jgi:peroxiredoxin
LCLAYGLIPTGRLDRDARAYLEAANRKDLGKPLTDILSDGTFQPAKSQSHPLLGKPAPEFSLSDDQGATHQLSELRRDGPVVVVFYYGYYCSHCVAQLFGIHDDIAHFRELGVKVVAISADRPEETAEKQAEYGRFAFPAMSDPEDAVAERYGVYRPATSGKDEQRQHGTFIVDREGTIVWANRGPQPFVDNKSLLFILAQAQGQLPKPLAANVASERH